jgi:hypothetical protein
MATITIYSHPGTRAVDLSNSRLGPDVDLNVLSTVNGYANTKGVTVIEVDDSDAPAVRAELDGMAEVESYR